MALKNIIVMCLCVFPSMVYAQKNAEIAYRIETTALTSDGDFAPLWFTANRYSTLSNESNQFALSAGMSFKYHLKHAWKFETGVELNGGGNIVPKFGVQQAYADISWKSLTLSIGAKERVGGPLEKSTQLTGGWMVEGTNMRPIPQVRAEIKDYLIVPGTGQWFAVKGHLSYGWFLDGNWQQNFVGVNQKFTKDVLFHSKSLMMRVGNVNHFPLELEFGIITAAQFGGKLLHKDENGTILLDRKNPHGMKEFFKVLIPKQTSTLANVSGNHCGSWNFALNTSLKDWKIRMYYEHFFEDHSQMFWEYGPWKDGLVGLEVSLPANRWISTVLWEGMSTKDQTGPVLYDGVGGSFGDLQMSGNDHYYNNFEYLGWQYYGATLGHPFLYGPQYNIDKSNYIKSTRVRSNHFALAGNPSSEWEWRLITSFVRHWGTYRLPLDKQRKQFSSLFEVSFKPQWAKGWSSSFAIGWDKGNQLGDSKGVMLTLRKKGGLKL